MLQRRHHCGSLGPQQPLMCNPLAPGAPRLRRMLQRSTQCSSTDPCAVQSIFNESECQIVREKACTSMQASACNGSRAVGLGANLGSFSE